MYYLIGDIGNTQSKFCILDKKYNPIKKMTIETLKLKNKKYFKNIFFNFLKNKTFSKKAIFSSVVPWAFLTTKKTFKKYFDVKSYELKQTNYSNIIKIKANKKQVGSDRIANAIGASSKYKTNCIILDLGTATTFDVIVNGTYLGGIIAPGIDLSLRTLIQKADQIPAFTLKKPNKVVGNDTISALRSGFYWGYAGLIENILFLIRKETKKNYKIILTGGFSSLFKNSIKTRVLIDQDITLLGLVELIKVK